MELTLLLGLEGETLEVLIPRIVDLVDQYLRSTYLRSV